MAHVVHHRETLTQMPGYVYSAPHEGNGWFVVYDRSELDPKGWRSGLDKNRWLVKRMADGSTTTAETFDAAKFLANVSAQTVHTSDKWWL